MTLLKHELKMNIKSLMIWSCCIGLINFGCLLLFESLADTMGEMAEAYSNMGSFSTALGMDRMSISTMEGFYATEVSLIFAVGGAMFAAMTGAGMLSKEEEGHTSEFLYTLPLGRGYIVGWKYASLLVLTACFQILCVGWELLGFALASDMPGVQEYILYHGMQCLMQMEVGSICYLISSAAKRKQIGAALGLAVLLYVTDMMCRIIPDIEELKYITPYYFSNAVDIFTGTSVDMVMVAISIGVSAAAVSAAAVIYGKRDLFA